MSEILAYMPTYSPSTEADTQYPRPYSRSNNQDISQRLFPPTGRIKPWVYMDAIDSILNTRPDIQLVVADGRSTESIRAELQKHQREAQLEHNEMAWSGQAAPASYTLELYPEKMSQWVILNDIYHKYATSETKYFVYTSSDVIWFQDWVAEAIKAFEKDPKLMLLFPTVSAGDPNLPCQVATGPQDIDPIFPPYQKEAKAPVLNAYAMIFRIDLLRKYDGYPTLFRNCYTESFLHYLCVAMGGDMKLLPRGWCYHHGTVDIWEENGSYYYYNEEINLFQNTMNKVQMMHGMDMMTPEFLKETLWK